MMWFGWLSLLVAVAAPAWADPARGDPPAQAARVVALEGASNFRDLGGYATHDGHVVRRDLIFRSSALDRLTVADLLRLRALGVMRVVDLRSTAERRGAPEGWTAPGAPVVLATDYDLSMAPVARVLGSSAPNEAAARQAMRAVYAELPTTLAPQYRQLFRELVANHTPLVFNCSAGKDRSGVAAALLLSILGVPRDAITRDYLLSNIYYVSQPVGGDATADRVAHLPPDVRSALTGVDASYLAAAFAAIDARPGGVTDYYRRELGLSERDIRRLKQLYLR